MSLPTPIITTTESNSGTQALPDNFVIVDLETTGGNPATDRITEIAIVRVSHGVVVDRWQTLVNPQQAIPHTIQRIIGITDAMVANAPSFTELAETIVKKLANAVFIAHNARFDYGFIRQSLARHGQDFAPLILCSVKLSRALYPEHHRHGLDALIERFDLQISARHRAMGDVEAVHQFLEIARHQFTAEQLAAACDKAMREPNRAGKLPPGMLEGLPANPGVYLFYSEAPNNNNALTPLFIGKSNNLRSRVNAYFSKNLRDKKEQALARQVQHIETISCFSEFAAAILEVQLLKTRPAPLHNKNRRIGGEAISLQALPERQQPPYFESLDIVMTDPRQWQSNSLGVFRHKKELLNSLHELVRLYRLNPYRLGLDGARANDANDRRESPQDHDQRLQQALTSKRLMVWPYDDMIALRQQDPQSGEYEWHLLAHWCHLGCFTNEAELLNAWQAAPALQFDLDIYQLIRDELKNPARNSEVVRYQNSPAGEDNTV